LGVAELFTGTLVLAMVAAGAAIAALGAGLGAPLWLQAILFATGSVASIWGVRPFLKQALDTSDDHKFCGAKAIAGAEATVLEQGGSSGGLVEIAGDNWAAYPRKPEGVRRPGERGTVVEITGATVTVWRQS